LLKQFSVKVITKSMALKKTTKAGTRRESLKKEKHGSYAAMIDARE